MKYTLNEKKGREFANYNGLTWKNLKVVEEMLNCRSYSEIHRVTGRKVQIVKWHFMVIKKTLKTKSMIDTVLRLLPLFDQIPSYKEFKTEKLKEGRPDLLKKHRKNDDINDYVK